MVLLYVPGNFVVDQSPMTTYLRYPLQKRNPARKLNVRHTGDYEKRSAVRSSPRLLLRVLLLRASRRHASRVSPNPSLSSAADVRALQGCTIYLLIQLPGPEFPPLLLPPLRCLFILLVVFFYGSLPLMLQRASLTLTSAQTSLAWKSSRRCAQ